MLARSICLALVGFAATADGFAINSPNGQRSSVLRTKTVSMIEPATVTAIGAGVAVLGGGGYIVKTKADEAAEIKRLEEMRRMMEEKRSMKDRDKIAANASLYLPGAVAVWWLTTQVLPLFF